MIIQYLLPRFNIAIVAGRVVTALNPLTLWDVGFQISFLATLSLIVFATPMTERFERLMARLLLAVCPLLFVTLDSLPDGKLHVHFLDVGQGEAVLIVTPDGPQVLIDGGASPTALLGELGRLMPFYDREIELVVLTHAGVELDLKANSLVLRLSWGRTCVLLLGDATKGVQEEVVESGGWTLARRFRR